MKRREMGPYVLLHKLAEDTLAQTYRAGLKSGDDVERVVLLCLFQTGGDVGWIAETASVGHRALQGLESPHLADLVESGEIEGKAFLAYDYVPGITLSGLMRESKTHRTPVPLGLSLLIVNRAAEALMAAWQHESRMLHGFLVPALVLVSNEGEVQVLGFEVASRLRRLFNDEEVKAELGPYLAPEVVPEGQPATTDDVYSLGAMLYELATGSVPPATDGELQEAVENATGADGQAIPDEVRNLLATSLASPPRRVALKDWSEALREIILSGRYEASSFDLAFFLNRLLGHDFQEQTDAPSGPAPDFASESSDASAAVDAALATVQMQIDAVDDEATEAEAEEASVEAEVLATGAWAAAAADHPGGDDQDTEELPVAPGAMADESGEGAGSQKRVLALAAVLVAVLLATVGYTYFTSDDEPVPVGGVAGVNETSLDGSLTQPRSQLHPTMTGSANDTATGAVEGELPLEAPAPVEVAAEAPSQEEIDQRVQDLVSKQSQTIEASLREEYANQIAELQAELEAQRLAAESTPPADGASGPAGSLQTAELNAGSLEAGAGGLPSAATAVEGNTQPGATGPAGAQPASQTTAGLPNAAQAATNNDSTGVDLPQRDYSQQAPQPGAPATQPDAAATESPVEPVADAEPVDESPPAREGDLVELGIGVTPPSLEKSVQPAFPLIARRLGKEAVLTVRVLIDENGKVIDFEPLGEKAGYGFDESAEKAARSMVWSPAMKDGVRVKIWWNLRLAFQP